MMNCLSLFEFVGEFGENRRVFVEFVGRGMLVDFWLAQNPSLPTTDAKFSGREILKFATSNFKVANFKIHSPSFLQKNFFPSPQRFLFQLFQKKFLWKEK